MNYDITTDVTIIGAGPAGTTTSLFLAKEKIPHLLIDKCLFPRDKICGDAISGKTVQILGKLDKNYLNELNIDKHHFTDSWGIIFGAPNGKSIAIPFKKNLSELTQAPGFICKRIYFDNFLVSKLDKKYSQTLFGSEVTDIQYNSEGVEIFINQNGMKKIIHSKIVVGAEGDRSIVAKKLAQHKKEPSYYSASIRAYYKGVTNFHPNNFIELYFLKELLPGYFWIFPLPNGEANIGVGVLSNVVSRKKMNLRQQMLQIIEQHPVIKERFKNAELVGDIKGWGLPLGSVKRNISGNNFLLVGDAASLIDPFTGEGIGTGMQSGMIAAQHISKALQQKQFNAKSLFAYDEEIYKKLGPELRLSYRMQQLTLYPYLLNFIISKANKNKTLKDTISCMFEDLDMRKQLKDPKFYFKLLFNK